jgi:hypothetical protein
MKRPAVLLMDGSVFVAPATEFPLVSTDTRSVLGWTTNDTEPVAVCPVLSFTVNVAVKLPAAVGVPLTTPVAPLRDNPFGKTPPNSVQINGAVPPVVTNVAE